MNPGKRETNAIAVAVILAMLLVLIVLLFPSVYDFIENNSSLNNEKDEADYEPEIVHHAFCSDPGHHEESPGNVTDSDPYGHSHLIWSSKQIPMFNMPTHYDLNFRIFLPWKESVDFGPQNFTLFGMAKISFTTHRNNCRFQLHSSRQNVSIDSIADDSGRRLRISMVSCNNYVLDVFLLDELMAGRNYTASLRFSGSIRNSKKMGVYSAPYRIGRETRWVMTTHLQTQDARALFPCFDHPMAKATFAVNVEHPIGTIALSNSIELSTSTDGEWTSTSFESTPKMSTYLFALSVNDFEYEEVIFDDRIRIRVYMEASKINDTTVAIEVLPKLIAYFENYFNYSYPLKKLDLLSLSAMKVIAMENWGLITIMSKLVGHSTSIASKTDHKEVTDVIAHELAHMWFGNLVTMKWWNDLWLNEGFATMVGLKASDYVENTTALADEIAEDYGVRLKRPDQFPEMTVPVSRHSEDYFNPETAFTATSYKKASFIMRMFEQLVGEKEFRQGLRRFIHKFTYGNTDHDDLLASFRSMSVNGVALTDVLSTWIYQKGFPILFAKTSNDSDGTVVLSQKAYRHSSGPPLESDNYQWKIPIFVRNFTTNRDDVIWLLENRTVHVEIDKNIVVDRNCRTLLRVEYDREQYEAIVSKLQHNINAIPAAARARILDDSLTLAEIGRLSYEHVFNLLLLLKNETSNTPVLMFFYHTDFLLSRLNVHQDYPILQPHFNQFQKHHVDPRNMSLFQDRFRTTIFSHICLNGHQPCVEFAKKLLNELRSSCRSSLLSNNSCNRVPMYLRQTVYATVAKFGNDSDVDFLFDKWEMESYQEERERIWAGICACRSKEQIHRLWSEVLFDHQRLIREDSRYLFVSYSRYNYAENHFVSFVSENIHRLLQTFHDGDAVMQYIVQTLGRSIFTLEGKSYEMFEAVAGIIKEKRPALIPFLNLKRIRSLVSWRNSIGHYAMGNLTVIVNKYESANAAVVVA